MVRFEQGKEIAKDVFSLVTNVSYHEAFGFRARYSTTEPQRLYGERDLLRSSYETRPAFC